MAAPDGTQCMEVDMEDDGELFRRLVPEADAMGEHASADTVAIEEAELMWAAVERLPSVRQRHFAVVRTDSLADASHSQAPAFELVDVRKMDRHARENVLTKAFATVGHDNYNLLAGIRERFAEVGLEVPKVEVTFENLTVSTKVRSGSRALPTLSNYVLNVVEALLSSCMLFKPKRKILTILDDVSGIIKPGRMTLLLGPPGSGKTTLLLALAGKLDGSLKRTGDVKYNGYELHKFFVQRTSAYISQTDDHVGELTVRETLDFGARCQGASHSWAENLKELIKLEKEKSIHPSPEIDAFMKAASVGGENSLVTDYTLKVLGLDVCADTLVGSDMVRGVSGGQKKRVTLGEMIVGPRKTLFMDEISTGLDSATTYQIVKCMLNFAHQMEATLLMSLLQPAPETFNLFDDLILLSEGKIVYQGPIDKVLDFFQTLGFSLPARKGVADFLQEVTSRKDQEQYWSDKSKPYAFVPTSTIAQAFKESEYGRSIQSDLLASKDGRVYHPKALAKTNYAISKWNLLKACFYRELLLISRHKFLYIFRTGQVAMIGLITCTTFFRSRLRPGDEISGSLYLSCLFFGLVHLMFNGFSELPITISRLPVFFKQRDSLFYPAWAFSLPSWLLRIPYSTVEAVVWSCVVYYAVGFAPSAGRFFRFMLLLFSIHQMALGLFRMIASLARSQVVANTFGSAALLIVFLLGGFIVPKDRIKPWWAWGYWVSPLSYGQRAISINEFGDPRWSKMAARRDMTVGESILVSRGLPTKDYWYWIGIGVLLAYSVLFNIVFTLSLKYLNPRVKAQAVVASDSEEKMIGCSQVKPERTTKGTSRGKPSEIGMCLPFQPLVMTFHNVNYFVDMPEKMKRKGVPEKRLQLLTDVSGVFRPGVLTALVGSSGAGKTTLMDVLAGRKTGGYVEGEIQISGYAKDQRTFARVAGYVEQNDIHSPQVTVEESLWFSSSLRLPREVSPADRRAFVEEVMSLVELEPLRRALVGLPGTTGLSTEQRKRLTIAVELVANPSIIFMDEPTSGLDARAAAIVMRTVRNTVDTGRTVVCTIHQPSIDIFEAFDALLLMKRGGLVIYCGPLGVDSQDMIDYFESIEGVNPIPDGYNPATWMLEISTPAMEEKLGIDFATVYRNSDQFRKVEALIEEQSVPAEGTHPLTFDTQFAQDKLSQLKVCCWKQLIVYWRSPEYNAVRLFFTALSALIFGSVFWNVGSKMSTTQDLTVLMGSLYSSCLFVGVNNAASVQPVIAVERTVYYRERATRMYASLPYAAAQGLVEIPYLIAQTIIYGVITFFMINYERTAAKFFMYLLFMFLTLMYFTFYGMMAVGLTPSQHLAAVISSAFYSLWNLMSGFLIPKPFIPGWWVWFYYVCPVAWTLRGIFTSQLGDVDGIVVGPGFKGSVKLFMEKTLGYDLRMTGITVVVLLSFSVLFFSVYAVSIKVLNFQRR